LAQTPFALPVAAPERDRYLEMHGFEKALHEDYYARVGYEIDLARPPIEAFDPAWSR